MGNVVRALGLVSAAIALGSLLALGKAKPGTTGFAVPWRYWGVAAGLLIEGSGIYFRFALWGDAVNVRDFIFLAINACIIVCCIGTLTVGPDVAKEGGG